MLDPPPIIKFLERACSVRIEGCYILKWGRYSIVARQRTSVGFKLAVHSGTGAGGLVVTLPCTAYSVKLATLLGCSFPQQVYA